MGFDVLKVKDLKEILNQFKDDDDVVLILPDQEDSSLLLLFTLLCPLRI